VREELLLFGKGGAKGIHGLHGGQLNDSLDFNVISNKVRNLGLHYSQKISPSGRDDNLFLTG
jgi:hypothetical protein